MSHRTEDGEVQEPVSIDSDNNRTVDSSLNSTNLKSRDEVQLKERVHDSAADSSPKSSNNAVNGENESGDSTDLIKSIQTTTSPTLTIINPSNCADNTNAISEKSDTISTESNNSVSSNTGNTKRRSVWGQGLVQTPKAKEDPKVDISTKNNDNITAQEDSSGIHITSPPESKSHGLSKDNMVNNESNSIPIVEVVENKNTVNASGSKERKKRSRTDSSNDIALSDSGSPTKPEAISLTPTQDKEILGHESTHDASDQDNEKKRLKIDATNGAIDEEMKVDGETDPSDVKKEKQKNSSKKTPKNKDGSTSTSKKNPDTPSGSNRGRPPGASNGTSGRKRQQEKLSRKKDRVSIAQIFSNHRDLARAFNSIRYMVDMQQGAREGRIELSKLRNTAVPSGIGKVPLPLLSEISFSLDLVESHSEYLCETMLAIRSRQVILENMLAKKLNGDLNTKNLSPVSFLPLPVTLNVNISPSENESNHLLNNYGSNFNAGDITSDESQGNLGLVSPKLLKSIQEQNRLRIVEAHLFSTFIHGIAYPKGNQTINNGLTPLSSKSVTELITNAIIPNKAAIDDYAAHNDASYNATKEKIEANREIIKKEIIKRKMSKLQAWEELGNRFLWAQHRWNKHIETVERGDERDTNAERESPRLRSLNGDVVNGLTSVRRSSNLFSSGDMVRSEYEQERLLKQLELSENLNNRITKNAAPSVNQLTPWNYYDIYQQPTIPEWDNSATIFTDANGEPLPTKYESKLPKYPSYYPDSIDFVDITTNRLTTDGLRQQCAHFPDLTVRCAKGCNCARQVDRLSKYEKPWSDVEKAIFIDKFLQFPKNFHKISSYLKNRTTKDCIKFYYDSKYAIPFKPLLREFDNRRRQVRNNWTHSIVSAESVGSKIYPSGDFEDTNEPYVELPVDDSTYQSFLNHPPFMPFALQTPSSRLSRLNLVSSGRNEAVLPVPNPATVKLAQRRIANFIAKKKDNETNASQSDAQEASVLVKVDSSLEMPSIIKADSPAKSVKTVEVVSSTSATESADLMAVSDNVENVATNQTDSVTMVVDSVTEVVPKVDIVASVDESIAKETLPAASNTPALIPPNADEYLIKSYVDNAPTPGSSTVSIIRQQLYNRGLNNTTSKSSTSATKESGTKDGANTPKADKKSSNAKKAEANGLPSGSLNSKKKLNKDGLPRKPRKSKFDKLNPGTETSGKEKSTEGKKPKKESKAGKDKDKTNSKSKAAGDQKLSTAETSATTAAKSDEVVTNDANIAPVSDASGNEVKDDAMDVCTDNVEGEKIENVQQDNNASDKMNEGQDMEDDNENSSSADGGSDSEKEESDEEGTHQDIMVVENSKDIHEDNDYKDNNMDHA